MHLKIRPFLNYQERLFCACLLVSFCDLYIRFCARLTQGPFRWPIRAGFFVIGNVVVSMSDNKKRGLGFGSLVDTAVIVAGVVMLAAILVRYLF